LNAGVATVPVPRTHAAGRTPIARLAAFADAESFVLLALAAGSALALVALPSIVGADTWLTLLGGRVVATSGPPAHDAFAYWTAGRRWVDQQWLAQVTSYGLLRVGGFRLLAALDVLIVVGSLAALAALARVRGASSRAVAPICVGVILLVLPFDGIRAQVFAYPLAAGALWLCFGTGDPRARRLLLAVPLLVLWANMHGSVLLGAALVAATAIEGARRHRDASFLIVAVGALASVFASPYASALPSYYRRVLLDPSFGKLVTEWQSPTVRTQTVFFVAALLVVVLVTRHVHAYRVTESVALIVSMIAALLSTRNIVWFAFLVLALCPRAIEREWPDRDTPRRVRVNVAASIAAVGLVGALFASTLAHTSFERRYPAAAASTVQRVLATHPSMRVFATEQYADWLLYRVPQSRGRVAFDARFELLTGDELDRIARFERHEGAHWNDATTGAGLLVVPPALADVGAGRELYRDEFVAVVLTTS
jgi:hypothetical protein